MSYLLKILKIPKIPGLILKLETIGQEGKATDDDMKSVASLMSNSTIPNNDIADLDTLLEDDGKSNYNNSILTMI